MVKGVYHEHYIQSSRTFRCPHQRNQVLYGLLRFKKLFLKGLITKENCDKANVAIAEKYGVLEYYI